MCFCRPLSHLSMARTSLPDTAPSCSIAQRLESAVASDSRRAVASLESGLSSRVASAPTAIWRLRVLLRARIGSSPSCFRHPSTAAPAPCGSVRTMRNAPAGESSAMPPASRISMQATRVGCTAVRLHKVFLTMRLPSRRCSRSRMVGR